MTIPVPSSFARKSLLAIVLMALLVPAAHSSTDESAPAADVEHLRSLARSDLPAFVREVSEGSTSDLESVHRIVRWFTTNFQWLPTDYQERTVDQILERGGGNCDDLARVTRAALESLHLEMRRVHELNVHREDADRGRRAAAKVAEKGPGYSVFGRHHNDHVWLEIHDRKTGDWFPADPSIGLVGEDEWLAARVGFGSRVTLNPLSKDMLVPFAIVTMPGSGEKPVDRTRHYLVEGFDHLYGDSLAALPHWKAWVAGLDELREPALGALRGKHDLLRDEKRIDQLWSVYEGLRREYLAR